jgi:hypothetical protein
MQDLEGFTKTLEASGVKLDTPYRTIPQLGFAVALPILGEPGPS